ncbi:hypothetical protein [Salmonirosea aquatica]|uniref:Uncharacterized protein n=1 Tax=Salmonirosea aquatica TaxID=2654236 RepID=A0A7C9BE58_9BACT|nr:hypothetical protein [Cytophagaceae bacterium SJW1-29]
MKILKPIVFGILWGIALFYLPFFVLRVAIVFLIIASLFRLFRGREWHRRGNYGYIHERRLAFADKIRAMSDEEYFQFKQNQSKFRDFEDEANTGNRP